MVTIVRLMIDPKLTKRDRAKVRRVVVDNKGADHHLPPNPPHRRWLRDRLDLAEMIAVFRFMLDPKMIRAKYGLVWWLSITTDEHSKHGSMA